MTNCASRTRLSLAIALLAAWWAICWLGTGDHYEHQAKQAYRQAGEDADRLTANLVKGYNRIIAVRTGMPRLLARDPFIRRSLARYAAAPGARRADEESRRQAWSADPNLAATSRWLAEASRDLGLDAFWLLDANGDCIAASNAGSERSLVGTDYHDRNYFKAAQIGRNGHQVNIGRRLSGAGLSFYAPIIEDGRFLGVMVGGIELAPFGNWFDRGDSFLTDRYGVIVLGRDPALLGLALPGAPAESLDAATRQRIYKKEEIGRLDLTPWGDPRFPKLLRLGQRSDPLILRSLPVADGDPTLTVLWPLPQLAELEQKRLLYTYALGTIGTLLMLIAAAISIYVLEQRAARDREFHTLVDQSPDPFVRYDRDLRRAYVNPAYERTHEVAATEVLGKKPSETPQASPKDVLAYEAVLAQVLASGQETSIQLEWLTPDEQERCLHLRIVPEVDGEQRSVGLLAIGRDILPLRRIQRELEESRACLQELGAHREKLREAERRRVARELHEELGQVLSALRFHLTTLRIRLDETAPQSAPQTSAMLNLIDNAIDGVRATVTSLRPTVLDVGIATALAWQAADFTRLTRIPCTTELDAEEAIDLPENTATAVFRIVEEALSNVARHAGACRVFIRLCRQEHVFLLEVADDGCGFATDGEHDKRFGLLGMRERAAMLGGYLEITSTPARGTVISARFPT